MSSNRPVTRTPIYYKGEEGSISGCAAEGTLTPLTTSNGLQGNFQKPSWGSHRLHKRTRNPEFPNPAQWELQGGYACPNDLEHAKTSRMSRFEAWIAPSKPNQ